MNKDLYEIQRQINQVQLGLLRFHNNDKLLTIEVKTTVNEDAHLNCIITDDSYGHNMADKNVHLIQKRHNDYLFITGKVLRETRKKIKTLSIRILKAGWFVRKRKDGISWLKQKCVYESDEKQVK